LTTQYKAPTRFDAFLGRWAPGWAERRAVARHNIAALSGYERGYAGGIFSRERRAEFGYRSQALDEDTLAGTSLENMRLEAYDLYRNDALAQSGVDGIVKYLGHSVPTARSAAKAKDKAAAIKWDEEATEWFNGWFWNRADAARRPGVTFGNHQDYVTLQSWLAGDMAFVWTGDGFEPVEGERIATPADLSRDKSIVRGVRRDSRRRPTHLYVCDRGDNGSVDLKNFTRVPINTAIYCPWYWRPDQVRGVPGLHSVVEALRDHAEIHRDTKMKVKSEARMVSIEKAGAVKNRPGTRLLDNGDGTKTEIVKSDWGMRVRVDGSVDDFKFASGSTPNAQYVPFLTYNAQLIAAGMGMPFEVLMHLFTNGSYTAQRTARMDFYHLLLDEHAWRVRVFNQRVWNLVVPQAIRDGYLPPAPVDARGVSLFGEVSWSLPHMLEIDIGKETEAQKQQWQLGTGNLEQFASERQTTREKLLDAKRSDIEAAMRIAAEINQGNPGAGITWRDIIDAGGKTEKAAQVAAAGNAAMQPMVEDEDEDDEEGGT